jgi:hypothetical protein|tara:strand:- start:3040 stop:3288 length:249 start_codon:yes stop_codon:yes gene_type:complete
MTEEYIGGKPPPEDGQVLTGKYTPSPKIAAAMVGMIQAIEEDVRKQCPHITHDEIIIQIVGSVIVTFGQSITGKLHPDESTH